MHNVRTAGTPSGPALVDFRGKTGTIWSYEREYAQVSAWIIYRIMPISREESLCGLYGMTADELMQFRGIGKVKAVQLECIAELSRRIARSRAVKAGREIFRNPEQIADYYMEDFRHESQEKLLLIMLDTKGHLIADEIISVGTVDRTVASPRDIFLKALSHRAVTIVLLHNHPSGNPEPSEADLQLTKRVRECGEMIGIPLVDHIIIGDRRSVSFACERLL